MTWLRRIGIAGGLLVLFGMIWGAYSFVTGWQKLAPRLAMGGGQTVSPSTSMEPYEINLRRMEVDKNRRETGRVLEWKLSVPRAYLFDETGKNGTIFNDREHSTSHYGFVLQAQFDYALDNYLPSTMVQKSGNVPLNINLGASNLDWSLIGSRPSFIIKHDLCVPENQFEQAAAKYGIRSSNTNCYDNSYRCTVYTQLDGWLISTQVTLDLFAKPETACKIIKDFLNKHTIKRDKANDIPVGATP